MPKILNESPNRQYDREKYIYREAYDWSREQRTKDNKETFVNATVVIAAVAVYATWAWMIVQKIKA